MRIERVVINASPLITLFRAGLHPLLPQLFPELVVPTAGTSPLAWMTGKPAVALRFWACP